MLSRGPLVVSRRLGRPGPSRVREVNIGPRRRRQGQGEVNSVLLFGVLPFSSSHVWKVLSEYHLSLFLSLPSLRVLGNRRNLEL